MNNRVAKCLLVSSLCAIVCHGMKQPGQLSAEVIRSCINGNVQEVEEFLRKCPQSLEDKDRNGFTPLMLAADVGHRSLAEMLLHRGARREALYETGQGMIKSTYDIIKIRLENAARRQDRDAQHGIAIMYEVAENKKLLNDDIASVIAQYHALKN